MEKRENETLTVRDIKQILNISINAAYNLIHSKSFPVIRIGNSFRVPKEPFYEWMKSSHSSIRQRIAGHGSRAHLHISFSVLPERNLS